MQKYNPYLTLKTISDRGDKMDLTCPSFIANSSEESDGGYSSHDTSQEESMTSFCYRNYLGDWKTWVQTNWYLFHLIISGYGYPVIVSKGSSVLLSQHTALSGYDGMRKGTAIWFKSSLKFCTYILTWNIAYSIILSFALHTVWYLVSIKSGQTSFSKSNFQTSESYRKDRMPSTTYPAQPHPL